MWGVLNDDEPTKPRQKGGEKMMHVGGQTGAFPPRLVASIRSLELHTHTHAHIRTRALNLHMETEIGLLIVLRQRDLKGRQRCLCVETCLQIVTANRKTIGDLNSQWSSQPSPRRLRCERTPIVSWWTLLGLISAEKQKLNTIKKMHSTQHCKSE